MIATAAQPLAPPEPLLTILDIVSLPNFVLIWLFGLALFEDDFDLNGPRLATCLAYVILMVLLRLAGHGIIQASVQGAYRILDFVSVVLMVHLIWTILAGKENDLVAARRSARIWLPIGIAVAAGCAILVQLLSSPSQPQLVSVVRVGLILPFAVCGFLLFVKIDPTALNFENQVRGLNNNPSPAMDPRDVKARERLLAIMEEDQAFREQGLTIRGLAEQLNIPEHQLRVLINRGLGYRNFTSFLNYYRLALAKSALADPNRSREQIIHIAMDVGYGSLASFNRTFKMAEGKTPSEYRKHSLAENVQNQN